MTQKGKSIIAYVFGLISGLIVLYGVKDTNKTTRLHAAQSTVMSVMYMVICAILGWIPFLRSIVWILYLVFFIIGLVKACSDENPEIPGIANIAKEIFGKRINEAEVIEVKKDESEEDENNKEK